MPGTRWFGDVEMGASYPSEPVVLEELERVLDAARPANIDPVRSNAVDGSFVIAYTLGFIGDIEIEVEEDWADLKSVVVERKIRASEFGPGWIRETAQAVDQIIRGHHYIDRTLWRNKIIRTDVTSQGHTTRTASPGTACPSPTGSIPRADAARLRLQSPLGPLPLGLLLPINRFPADPVRGSRRPVPLASRTQDAGRASLKGP